MTLPKRQAVAVRLLSKLDQQIQEARSMASSDQLTYVERKRASKQRRAFEELAERVEGFCRAGRRPEIDLQRGFPHNRPGC